MELESAERRLYVGGAADLLGEVRAEELDAYRSLFELVERRADLLDVLGQPSSSRVRSSASATSSRIRPSPRSRSSARATGSSTGRSAPSASSVPCGWTTRRRSGPSALPRSSSRASSSRSTTKPEFRPRTLATFRTMATTDRDYYELLGVARGRERGRDQARLPAAGARAPSRRVRRAGRAGAIPRGGRGVRGALEDGDARALRPLRPRRAAERRLPGRARRLRQPRRPLLGVLRRRRCSAAAPAAAARAAPTSRRRSRSSSSRPRTASRARCRSRWP